MIAPFYGVPLRLHRAGAGPFLLDFYRDAMPAEGWSEVEAETDAEWEVQWAKDDRLIRLSYIPEAGGGPRTMRLFIELCPPLTKGFCES